MNEKAAKSHAVLWIKLQNSKKMGKQFFFKEVKYLICITSHMKGELGEKDITFLKSQM